MLRSGKPFHRGSDGETTVETKKRKIQAKSETTIDDLPDELMLDILSRLSLNERKITRLVCKRWKELNYRKCLIMKDTMVVCNYVKINNRRSTSVPHVVNLRICVPACEDTILRSGSIFWGSYGTHVQTVFLIFDKLCFTFLYSILKNCQNLRCLIIEDMGFGMCNCKYIRKLDCSTLEKFTIYSVHGMIVRHFPYFLFGKVDNMKSVNLTCHFELSANDTKHLQRINGHFGVHITSFTIDIFGHSSDDLMNIFSNFGSQVIGLTRVDLSGTPDDALHFLASKCTNLQKIACEIITVAPLSQGKLNRLCESLSRLTHVTVKCLTSHLSLAALGRLPHLAFLDVEGNASAIKNLFPCVKPKMVFLKLALTALYDDHFSVLFPKLPNLLHLEIFGPGIIFGKVLSSIAQHNPRLQCLILRNKFRALSGVEFTSYLRGLTELVHLEVTDTDGNAMDSLGSFLKECVSLKRLRTLVTDCDPAVVLKRNLRDTTSLFESRNFEHLSGNTEIPNETRPLVIPAEPLLAVCRRRAGSGEEYDHQVVVVRCIYKWNDSWSIIPTITYR